MPVTIHTFRDLPDDARAFWERVRRAQDSAAYFTSSPEWVELMAGDGPCTIAVSRDAQGRCTAVLPCLHRAWELDARVLGRRLAHGSLAALKVGGGDLIEEGLSDADLDETVRALFDARPDADVIWFECVGEPGRYDRLVSAAGRGGRAFAVPLFRGLAHHRLRLPPTWDAAQALRSTKSQKRLRSKEKALEREAGAPGRVVQIRSPADWGPYAERIERLVDQSWQSQLLGQSFRLDGVRGTAERGWLRGFLLLAGEEPLAFTLYYQGMGTLISAVLAYDRRYARFSPGAILFQHTLRCLYESDRPEVLDFGEGDADYKQQWANEQVDANAVLLVRRTARTRAWFALYRATRAADRGARALLRLARLDRLLVRRAKRDAGAEDGGE